jgi:hypothetical protein
MRFERIPGAFRRFRRFPRSDKGVNPTRKGRAQSADRQAIARFHNRIVGIISDPLVDP